MKKTQNDQNGTNEPVCGMCVKPDATKPMASPKGQNAHKKSWWGRYVARLKKHEGDVRSCCR